jgi:hypothetical protein
MKFLYASLYCGVLFGLSCSSQPPQLLPGVTYFRPTDHLTGRLLLEQVKGHISTDGPLVPASILAIDVQTGVLSKVTEGAAGIFVTAPDGSAICTFGLNDNKSGTTHAFIYSEEDHKTNLIRIATPSDVSVSANAVAFYTGEPSHPESITKYNLLQGTVTELKRGDRDFSIPDWMQRFKAGDAYVFFDGKQSPFSGRRLVIAPYRPTAVEVEDPERKRARLIKKFSLFTAGTYFFKSVSPCGKYAFVRLDKYYLGKGRNPYTIHIYYIVDLVSGKTETLLLDETELKTPENTIVGLSWVGTCKMH